jgi:acyl carrier protein
MKKLTALLSKILKIKEENIHDDLTPSQVASWDSMNALVLVAELEKTYNIRFTMAEVIGVKCVGDIKKILKNHGVDLENDE